jgi:cytochrome oxidase Cu insertion factor (SCO1/SenC/PrrC family)
MTPTDRNSDHGVKPPRRRRDLLLLGCIGAAMMVCVGCLVGVALSSNGGARASAAQRLSTERVVSTRNQMDGDATWPVGKHPAPAIATLRDQYGKRFALSSLRGHSVALTFFDSYCHTSCPLEGHALARAESALPRSQRPILVAVSVDPRDSPKSAAQAIRKWGLQGKARWYWLMGTRAQLAPIWRAYHIYVHSTYGNITHTEALYLIGRDGDFRSAYLWPFAGRFVTHDLRMLARTTSD